MRVPISWLKEYAEFDAAPEEVASRLTFSGTEVESIESVGSDCEGVVVGKILEVSRHPAADSLRVCRVTDGDSEAQVVCGAENFGAGDHAPWAKAGAVLADGKKIRDTTIRGEPSRGMLCAEDELGISDDHSGIMLLARDLAPGTPFSEIMGPPETVLVMEVTWNRGDCLSVIGIARELAALYRTELKIPSVDYAEGGAPISDLTRVDIEDEEGCPRYTARYLSGVTDGPSPMWMQKRLVCCGVRPISAIVDITNYVMLECGQPLHAFDFDLLREGRIVVRRAREGERIATLDGIERLITPDMLVIADGERPVALAGIMGGAGSEIRDVTGNVLLESACFDAALLRQTSSLLGLSTESSHRFERKVDVIGVDWASRRAAALMVELAQATAARGVVDVFPGKPAERRVTCRFDKVRSLLGIDIPGRETADILRALQLPVVEQEAEHCTVLVPSFRPDLELEADLIEEVARIHGLDEVPARAPLCRVVEDADDTRTRSVLSCRSALVGLGLSEIVNYSFVSEALLDAFDEGDRATRIRLPNPVSADYALLRNALMPQMAETLGRNVSRQVTDAAFFEMGRVFLQDAEGRTREEERLAIGLMGKTGRLGTDRKTPVTPEEMFLWLKGIVESLAAGQHAARDARSAGGGLQFVAARHPALEQGWAVSPAADGRSWGVMGLLKHDLRREWRMLEEVAVAELALDPLLDHVFELPALKRVPRFPSIARDVALIVDERVSHEEIMATIRRDAPMELTSVDLFDIFRSKGIGAGKKSMAYSLIYRSPTGNLTDEDANEYHSTIKEALRQKLGAEIREG